MITNTVILAPMAGYTSFGYRKFMEPFGVGLTYTEMISDMGLIYQNKETESYINFEQTPTMCVVQIFGNDKDNLVKAAKIVKDRLPFIKMIDINMACPVKKVTSQGSGSSLLKDPEKIKDIVSAIKQETGLLVSAKIRLGIDNNSINFEKVVSKLIEGGVSLIAIHARTAKDLYTGKPRFELLKDLKSKMNVPLIVSGNIFTLEEAIKALEITKADGVMVARGAVGNPYLITQINAYLKDKTILEGPSINMQLEYLQTLAKFLIEEKGESKAMMYLRSMAPKFITNIPNCKQYRLLLSSTLKTYQDLLNIISQIRKELNIK